MPRPPLHQLIANPGSILIAQGMEPDPWQEELLAGHAPRVLLNCSRQSGKSRTVSALAVHTALIHPDSLVLLLSPTLRQSGELFRKVVEGYRAVGQPIPARSLTQTGLELSNQSRVVSLPGREETIRSFEALEGLVFPDFAARCVRDSATFETATVGGIDFGYRNPFAALWGHVDADGVLWITGERYERQQTIHEHARHLPRGVTWYADPAGAEEIAMLRQLDHVVRKGGNDLRAGIAAVRARLEAGKLKVLRDRCPNLLAEAQLYRYPARQDGGDVEKPIGWFEEYAFLQGDGVGKPLGILNAPAALTVTRDAANLVQFVDVAAMLAKLLPSSQRRAIWVIHPYVLAQLVQLADSSGRIIWVPNNGGAQDGVPGTLFGMPVITSEKLPALGTQGDCCLIDPHFYVIGDRQHIEIAASEHVNFLKNQMTWRVVERIDGQPWLEAPITLQDAASTVSPFVILD